MDFDFPFTTYLKDCSDPSFLGYEEEVKRLFQRQQLIDKLCSTEFKEIDVLLDMLAEHEIDPIDYVSSVQSNVEEIIANEMPIANKELFLGG